MRQKRRAQSRRCCAGGVAKLIVREKKVRREIINGKNELQGNGGLQKCVRQ